MAAVLKSGMINSTGIRWRLGALAGLAVVLVTLIPQASLWIIRGREWQGAYALTDTDELAYSAYLNSLINGKPRRNNPESPDVGPGNLRQPESIFSIQFIPPYVVAFGARLLGISASSSFIILTPLLAFASSLAVFWLLRELTGDDKAAAIGMLLILLCGILASANLITSGNAYAVFSFLRRYIPSVAFPLVFLFCGFIWRAYTRPAGKALWWTAAAGIVFGLLVYSYFFLWTAVGAWFFCFTSLWLLARPKERKHVLKCGVICAAVMVASILPYFEMLALRAPTTDEDQALVLTHAPDLFRFTEIFGAVIIALLAFGVRRDRITWRSPVVLFAASCAVVPFVVFNQQIITGRSLQPFHYEQFILNYLVLVSAVITDHLLWRLLQRRPVFTVALAIIVGLTLAVKTSQVHLRENILRDEAIPLFRELEEDALRHPSPGAALFDKTLLSASSQTTCSSLPLFWSLYSYTYGGMTTEEEHERLFQYFYYLGVDGPKLETILNSGSLFRGAVFGLTRVNSTLTQNFKPISAEEIRTEVDAYSAYVRAFSAKEANLWPLSYVILVEGRPYDLSNLDRWYERDQGEQIGSSVVFRVNLRSGSAHTVQ